ncbi:E3 ubiquitin protein ligase DRIP2-like [Abrus precatorius]|uniref:E3 ubiquitin protein ligase DRIP2-like n=1 Tax=Abrus precatorius TaxID=3816 RepID=A0A8B8M9A6_ABRPR|nr:E3 ubiquitin protein ligase DRIP2-like [Abrus precatorius]
MKTTVGKAKAAARIKFIRTELPPTCQLEKVTGEENKDDDHPQLETANKTSRDRVQDPSGFLMILSFHYYLKDLYNSSKPDSSQQILPKKILGRSVELWKEKADMSEPLSCLMEAASKSKSRNKYTMQENGAIPVLVDANDNDSQVPKVKVNKHCHMKKAAGEQNESTPSESNQVKLQKLQNTQEKRPKFSQDLNFPAQPVIGSNTKSNIGFGPVWEAWARLPQITSCYIRVMDGSLPVSFIKRYIVKKLGLASEAEVEISLRGEPVLSSLQLKNLVDLWLQTVPGNEIQTSVGSSAKDFVMVLSYGRKA